MIDTCFIDFDGTAFNTIKAICKMYEDDYSAYKDYEHVDWEDIHSWDFLELQLSPPPLTNMYFNQKRFFDFVEPMRGFDKFINKLKEDYKIVFCSIGDYPNIHLKESYLKSRYPFAEFIGVDMNEHKNKSHINMDNAIFIDDSYDMLASSNATYPVCFGKVYPWNEEWQGVRCENWEIVEQYIYYVIRPETAPVNYPAGEGEEWW